MGHSDSNRATDEISPRLLQKLLGQRIDMISSVVQEIAGSDYPLDDSLIIQSEGMGLNQFFTGHYRQFLENISSIEDMHVEGDFESEVVFRVLSPAEGVERAIFPFTVGGISEFWIRLGDDPYLLAAALHNEKEAPVISFLCSGDELELMHFEDVRKVLKDSLPQYGSIQTDFYSKSMK